MIAILYFALLLLDWFACFLIGEALRWAPVETIAAVIALQVCLLVILRFVGALGAPSAARHHQQRNPKPSRSGLKRPRGGWQ